MATSVAGQILAKGPLSSALGQYVFIGFGTFVIFTGDNGVSKAAQDIGRIAFKLMTGQNGSAASLLFDGDAAKSSLLASQLQQPIVIHNVNPAGDGAYRSSSSSLSMRGISVLFQVTLGAGCCWVSYVALSQLLPEHLKELLPVTRKFFDTAITSLGQGIIRVRDALSAQIAALSRKQDELATKQDSTHASVLGLRGDVGDVRSEIDEISLAIARCETSLIDAAGRQTYVNRGVRLLVQCVGDMVRNVNPQAAEELAHFARLDEITGEEGSAPVTPGGGESKLYPMSPQLSEISGSASHGHRDVVPFSLPQAQQLSSSQQRSSQSLLRRGSSSSPPPEIPAMPPHTSPFGVGGSHMFPMRSLQRTESSSSAYPPSYSGASTPSKPLQGTRNAESSPEDEVPETTAGINICLNDVDELLHLIQSGRASAIAV